MGKGNINTQVEVGSDNRRLLCKSKNKRGQRE